MRCVKKPTRPALCMIDSSKSFCSELFDLREEIMEKLADIEMTWGDRLRAEGRNEGEKKGRTEGKLEGERKMLLHLLTLLFGETPALVVERINAIADEETLALLARQIVSIKHLEELVLPEIDAEDE